MDIHALKRKCIAALSAAMLASSLSYAALPAPSAAAGSNILGAVLGGGVAAIQLNNEIKTYNNTEKGRQALFEGLKEKYGVNDDEELNQRLDTIMNNLTEAIASVDPSIREKPYNYFINKEKGFNAFCTLGHNLSVNTGLFSVLTNEDEIAVVLGHEMGHGQKDHPAKGARQSLVPAILASAAGNNIGAVILANAINNQGITKPMEREADALAFEYITHSNYNPGACAAVWQRVIDKSGNNPDTFATFLAGGSDHPSNASRRDTYAKKLHEYSKGHVTVEKGAVMVNGKHFATPASAEGMSGAERSYFVAGNLAAAYRNGHDKDDVHVKGNVVMLGAQDIMEAASGDEDAHVLSQRLASIK